VQQVALNKNKKVNNTADLLGSAWQFLMAFWTGNCWLGEFIKDLAEFQLTINYLLMKF